MVMTYTEDREDPFIYMAPCGSYVEDWDLKSSIYAWCENCKDWHYYDPE